MHYDYTGSEVHVYQMATYIKYSWNEFVSHLKFNEFTNDLA